MELSFEERVDAQRAIERVYYSHQDGAGRPFEAVFTRELLEHRVRDYLARNAALADFWKRDISVDDLQRELERIAANTQMPNR